MLASSKANTPALRGPAAVDPACWRDVQRFMLRAAGVVLADDQIYLLESRLASPAREHGFARIADFVRAACASPSSVPVAAALIDAMTTHETLFFRDPTFWTNLEQLVLPRLVAAAKTGRVKIWSAACSTGQEPYSLAMLIAERAPELADRVDIVATDVSELAVRRASAGVFSALETNRGLSAVRLVRHFEQAPGGFRVREALRRRITWSTHNLLGARPDPTACALVLCRNVLIYFGDTDRASVLQRLSRATMAGGVLGVGATETLKEPALAPGLHAR